LGGLDVLSAADAQTGLQLLETEQVDAIVLDLRMPGMDGRALFREVRARGNKAPVLIASAYGARQAQQELGAEAAIEKPFDPDELVDVVRQLIEPRTS
jgi:DNA-binding response OmpR family regulator